MAIRKNHRTIKNAAGGQSHRLPDHQRLLSGVLTCFFKEPKAYGDTSDEIVESARRVIKDDPEFVAKLACYARNEFHMRTISQVLAAEVAKGAKGHSGVRKMTRKVVKKPYCCQVFRFGTGPDHGNRVAFRFMIRPGQI